MVAERRKTVKMVFLRKTLIIVLLLLALPMMVAQPQATLTTEQEQQFTYYWYAARQAIEEQRYPDALALLEFCHSVKPNDGNTLTFLGLLYDSMGDKERALTHFRQAFEADPYDQWFRYSKALLSDGELKPAIAVLEKAYEVQKGGDKKKKIEESLLTNLQNAYVYAQAWDKAIAMQDELDQIKGFDAYSAMMRYRIYAMANKPKKAIAALDQYLEQDPNDLRFLIFRLELMEQTKAKQKELYAMYERILEIDPYNLMVLNNYAYHLATHGGDLKNAERMSAITIREDANNPVYLDTYGWILHLQGQDELALFYLSRAWYNATESTKAEIESHLRKVKGEK